MRQYVGLLRTHMQQYTKHKYTYAAKCGTAVDVYAAVYGNTDTLVRQYAETLSMHMRQHTEILIYTYGTIWNYYECICSNPRARGYNYATLHGF